MNFRTNHRRGFTITEMLVVIGIIVIIVVLALPALRAITGSRSVEAAHNQLSAILGRAHDDSLGLQDYRGVLFYVDPANSRVTCAEVMAVAQPPAPVPPPSGYWAPDVLLDLTPTRDHLVLPQGIGVQVINNTFSNGNASQSNFDRYIGFNPGPGPASVAPKYGGVILFDGNGRLVSRSCGFRMIQDGTTIYTNLGALLMGVPNGSTSGAVSDPFIPPAPASTLGSSNPPDHPLKSQFGFVVYDRESFLNVGGTDGDTAPLDTTDPTRSSYGVAATSGTEAFEETWLDNNSTPMLINRYTGTLIKGE